MKADAYEASARYGEARPEGLRFLSPRERAVIDRAVEGMTDEQIAYALDVKVSTVNSYWIRIRGKVGAVSRTQIVALVLRERFERERESLAEEIARLRAELRRRDEEIARLRGDLGRGA